MAFLNCFRGKLPLHNTYGDLRVQINQLIQFIVKAKSKRMWLYIEYIYIHFLSASNSIVYYFSPSLLMSPLEMLDPLKVVIVSKNGFWNSSGPSYLIKFEASTLMSYEKLRIWYLTIVLDTIFNNLVC